MKFFSKKKTEEFFFQYEDEDEEVADGQSAQKRDDVPVSSPALTVDEVLFGSRTNAAAETSSALLSLKKRMQSMEPQTSATDAPSPAMQAEKPAETPAGSASPVLTPQRSTAQEVMSTLDSLLEKAESSPQAASPDEMPEITPEPGSDGTEKEKESLLKKCRPYILDEDGNDTTLNAAPAYHLESVAEILKEQSNQTLEKLSEKYQISFDDLGKAPTSAAKPEPTLTKPQEKPRPAPKASPQSPDASPPQVTRVISDLDSQPADSAAQTPLPENTATIKFTPVGGQTPSGTKISVSSQTRSIDLTGEMAQFPSEEETANEQDVRLEQSEFEEFVPETEFTSSEDAHRLNRLLRLRKRNHFLTAVFSVLFTVALALLRLPILSDLALSRPGVYTAIGAGLTFVTVLFHLGMFRSVLKIFRRHSTADISACLATVFVFLYAGFAIAKNESAFDLLLLLSVILSARALGQYWKDSYLLSNFRQIAGSQPKHAVRLVGDSAVTFAMAKNAIAGDALIATPQMTDTIDDYMKYSTFGLFLSGKMPFLTSVFLLLSVITGFACASYFDGVLYGLYAAAAMQCLSALPMFFLIDNLPLYAAACKLNRVGAMIAGKTGAEQLEMANAVVLSAEDLFPAGTVTLHQMKILSDNSVDDTIIRAASLTETLDSTLAPIFKKIAGTGNITVLPDSDTVKYEEKMGISGWVDNRLLFIGNRTLLETHGISVPDVELDRKLLRSGYFPVYVASEDKACALLSVRYTVKPEVAKELRRLSSLGITLLINSTDPNLTEEMICDYMGLYDDSVKVMNNTGCHMVKSVASHIRHCSAPGAYKRSSLGLPMMLNCAGKIKKANAILSVFSVIAALLGAILFAYSSFDGSGGLVSGFTVFLYSLGCTVLSLLLYMTEKP